MVTVIHSEDEISELKADTAGDTPLRFYEITVFKINTFARKQQRPADEQAPVHICFKHWHLEHFVPDFYGKIKIIQFDTF